MSKRYEVYKNQDTTPFSSDTISSTSFQITFPSNTSTTTDDEYLIKYIDDEGCEATMESFKVLKRAPACTCDNLRVGSSPDAIAASGGSAVVSWKFDEGCTSVSVTPSIPASATSWCHVTTGDGVFNITVDNYPYSADVTDRSAIVTPLLGESRVPCTSGEFTVTQSAPEPPTPTCRLALIQEPYPNPNKGIVDGNNITFTSSSIYVCSSLSFYVESYGSTTAETLMPQATITEGGEYIKEVNVAQGFSSYNFFITFKIAPDNNQHSGKILVTNDCNSTGIEISITYKNNYEYEGTENGHDWVDLCLPSGTLWAKQNFGGGGNARYFTWANSDYYGAGYHDFTWDNYRTSSGYNLTDNITQGGQYDMARNVMGGKWVLPTVAQYQELFNNCTCCYSSSADKMVMTSNRNGKQITFDVDGCYCEGTGDNKRCGQEYPDQCLFERLWVCDYDSNYSTSSDHKCKAAQVEQRCKFPDIPNPCNLNAFTNIHSNQPVWLGMQIRGCFKK